MTALLEIAGLDVRFAGQHAVRGLDLSVQAGETHCLVGESGCGKSVSALAVMGLLPRAATRRAAQISFSGKDLSRIPGRELARLRGDRLAMIFQEPMTSLNPAYTIGSQMTEVLRRHRGLIAARPATDRSAMLARVGISAPAMRLGLSSSRTSCPAACASG